MFVVVISLSSCTPERPVAPAKALTAELQEVVGTWVLFKRSERGSVSRELTFRPDGVTLTTTCRSIFDDAIANAKGEGRWTVENGIISAKWTEKQTVGVHTQEASYDPTLQFDRAGKQVTLVVPENQDRYNRK
jgi:hypothetical protein